MLPRAVRLNQTRIPRLGRRRRVLPAGVRIEDVMNAAAELFILQGVETTTVDGIAAKAGMGKGTFYHYFASKADVVSALRERFIEEFIEQVSMQVNICDPNDHVGRFGAWLRSAIVVYLANFKLHDAVFHDFRHARRHSQEKDRVIDQLTDILVRGTAAQAWSLPDARTAALVLFDGMHGVIDNAIVEEQFEPAPLYDLLEQILGRILYR